MSIHFILSITMLSITYHQSWHRGVVVITTAQVHSHEHEHQNMNSGSAQVQILFAACQPFAMVRISDNGPGWK